MANCIVCNSIIVRTNSKWSWKYFRKRKFCSLKCYKKWQHQGENNCFWKGGISKHSEGYVLIYNSTHPHKAGRNYVFEHHLVMEKHLGRYLKSKEVVHHKNGVKNDNRIENLVLFKTTAKHSRYHSLHK